jgi:spore coat polysaccharide biosynthesis protein SpsF
VRECGKLGIPCFRGNETDVLERYYQAAKSCNADVVVRVTADNPFTDPASIDRAVESIKTSGSDYAIEMDLPVGTTGEALTWNALEFINSVAHTPQWREHVTLFAKENPHTMKCAFLTPPAECARPDLRFTVDYLSDYQHVRQLAQVLANPDFSLMKLIRIADDVSEAKRNYA